MPRVPRFPIYPRKSHPSGQARITVLRRSVYLGPFGSPESYQRYEQEFAAWRVRLGAGLDARPSGPAPPCLTVADVVARYYDHLTKTQRDEQGREKEEVKVIRYALRPLVLLHGETAPSAFGPKALKEVRSALLHGYDDPAAKTRRKPNCRKTTNRHVVRIRAAFRWAEEEELIGGGVWHRLRSVRPLAPGDDGCTDHDDVTPPPAADVAAVLAVANPVLRGMVLVATLSGPRPSELFRLTPSDITRDGPLTLAPGVQLQCGARVWAALLRRHKTRHKGATRVLLFGPKAQAALTPFLDRPADRPLFSPAEAVAAMRAVRSAGRTTKPTPSELRRRAKRKPRSQAGDRYDRRSFRQAVHRACDAAGVPRFNPYALRHSAATNLANEFGIDVARAILGHKSTRTTEIYVLADLTKAADALAKSG